MVPTVTEKSLGKARSGVYINQGICKTLAQREGENIINLPIPYELGHLCTQVRWHIAKDAGLLLNDSDLVNAVPVCSKQPRCNGGHFCCAPHLLYLQEGQLLGLIPGPGHQLPDCQGLSRTWKTVETVSSSCR